MGRVTVCICSVVPIDVSPPPRPPPPPPLKPLGKIPLWICSVMVWLFVGVGWGVGGLTLGASQPFRSLAQPYQFKTHSGKYSACWFQNTVLVDVSWWANRMVQHAEYFPWCVLNCYGWAIERKGCEAPNVNPPHPTPTPPPTPTNNQIITEQGVGGGWGVGWGWGVCWHAR